MSIHDDEIEEEQVESLYMASAEGKKKKKKDKKKAAASASDGGSKGSKPKKSKKKAVGGKGDGYFMLRSKADQVGVGKSGFKAEAKEIREAGLGAKLKKVEETQQTKNMVLGQLRTVYELAERGLMKCSAGDVEAKAKRDLKRTEDAIEGDADYQERIRFKHHKFHDLLDISRDFTASDLQKDLVRNREIQKKCSVLIRGDRDESFKLDDREMDELITLRNSLRTMFGGQNNLKGMQFDSANNDANLFNLKPTEIRVSGSGGQAMKSQFISTGDNAAHTGSAVD
jgi:hypothetical protein